jgi:uncharacterized RDD family membrane protein YckC
LSETFDPEEDAVPGLKPNGAPDPAYAAALGLIAASPGKRSLAFGIDAAIAAVLLLPAFIGAFGVLGAVIDVGIDGAAAIDQGSVLVPLILFAVGEFLISAYYIVQLLLHGFRGITIGKAICGIRSVRVTTFARPGFWRVVLRAVVFYAGCVIVPVLGAIPFLLSPLWDYERRGRGWLDRIGGNWLVDARRGLDPFDAKALRLARKRVAAPPKVEPTRLPSLATGAGVPTFVPDTRSSSAVIGTGDRAEGIGAAQPWSPPPIGASDPTHAPQPTGTRSAPPPPAPPASAPAPSPQSAPGAPPATATFVFDDGATMTVTGAGLLGRNPHPRDGENMQHLIPVTDDRLQISKTHAEFGFDASGLWISDRSSVNGTQIRTSNGARVEVPVGEHYPVVWGSVVEVGGRSFRVVRHVTDAAELPSRPPHNQEVE